MSPAGCTKPEEDTHIGFDRRPRLPFLPMTGVPKCSGLVRGSLSSVCTGEKWQHRASVPPFQTIKWKTKDLSSKPGKKSLHAIPSVKNGGIYPAWKYNIKKMDSTILTSLSAKWRAPFRQREERLRVFSSPSSNTADMTDKPLGCCMQARSPPNTQAQINSRFSYKMSVWFVICYKQIMFDF